MKRLLLASTVLAVLATAPTAKAADVEYAPESDWTGAYLGAVIGYGSLNWTVEDYDGDLDSPADDEATGMMGGVTIGYNYQLDSVVLGVEADYSIASLSGDIGGCQCGDFDSDWPLQLEMDAFATVRGRLGYAIGDFMIFGAGGLAYASTELSIPDEDGAEYDYESYGWTLGAGLEYKATENMSIKAEYLYANFDEDFNLDDVEDGDDGDSFSLDDMHVVRGGVNISF
ncbi:outer membrane protein [Aestuariivirga sp.]|uniref:outer membrane protein n=1 Tax=Aestuariivirga sp. TaxID=2650926 RepID=UPI0039196B14